MTHRNLRLHEQIILHIPVSQVSFVVINQRLTGRSSGGSTWKSCRWFAKAMASIAQAVPKRQILVDNSGKHIIDDTTDIKLGADFFTQQIYQNPFKRTYYHQHILIYWMTSIGFFVIRIRFRKVGSLGLDSSAKPLGPPSLTLNGLVFCWEKS